MKPTHIEHIGIAVKSLEEAIPFYENVLGLKCYAVEEVKDQKVKTAFFKVGQTKIELLESTDPVFILVIAVLVQFIEIFLKKYVVALYNSLGVYLPLITTNCCVLAVTILVVGDYGADVAAHGFGYAYIEALICAIGAGCGFMLAMVMFSGVRKRVEACDPPAPFKGLPITLIAAAITSLSFMGFGGIVENLFNVTL